MHEMPKLILQVALLILPWFLRRRALQSIFGFDLDPTARIGLSVIQAKRVVMAKGSRIGHLNFVKGIRELVFGESARIGNLNWITGFPKDNQDAFKSETARNPSFIIGAHSAVTHRHLIDCTNEVRIGSFTTFAGWRSQILTHGIDLKLSRQTSMPVVIGAYCFVGTGSILIKGCSLPNYSVLSAGSVLLTKETAEYALYSGIPAVKVRDLPADYGYFQRTEGYVY